MKCTSCPTIVVIAYNRPDSLKRLLCSLAAAHFPNDIKVSLVISIDGGGDTKTIDIARKFLWDYGNKIVIEHNQNLGLREHVLRCGDLSQDYGSVILLEDDLIVSPAFYDFTSQALTFYETDKRIAGISLYSNRLNETARCVFEPINNGYSTFLSKVPSSWGQAFSANQWKLFRDWLKGRKTLSNSFEIPENIMRWPESSWKKYFCDYNLCSERWFVYPYVSYTTNFGDVGCHRIKRSTVVQVGIVTNNPPFVFSPVENAIKYDLYWELLSDELRGKVSDVLWDIYGMKTHLDAEYVVSCNDIPGYRKIKGFAIDLKPIQLNYFMENEGADFWLQERVVENGNLEPNKGDNRDCLKFRRHLVASRFEWLSMRDVLLFCYDRLMARFKGKFGGC